LALASDRHKQQNFWMENTMRQIKVLGVSLGVALLVAACGGGDSTVTTTPARGALMQDPPLRTVSMTASYLQNSLSASTTGQGLLAVAGAPKCGVDVQYIQYGTVGGQGESTDASGVLMTPTGSAAGCSGSLPIVLYAHGTSTAKNYNLAALTDSTNPAYSEAILIAAMYAAQGFIVVAPNYAGYDSSKLSYHPYVNQDQNAKEMMDALAAARTALPGLVQPVQDSGKLFITGYSEGGYVAMATHKAMQAANKTVTASAPMSGPYALGAYMDAVFYGNVPLGATLFGPLTITSYQNAYGNVYSQLTDIYETTYAAGLDTLLPSLTPYTTLFTQGKLPQTQLFSSTVPAVGFESITPPTTPAEQAPLFALGFGTSNLIKNSTRLAYLMDAMAHPDGAVPAVTTLAAATGATNPLRQNVIANDLRGWNPARPVLLCGGSGDPTVFYSTNTQVMQGAWAANPYVSVLNVDVATPSGTFASAQAGFNLAKTETATAAVTAGATDGGASAVVQAYHGSLVPPFCNAAARGFFQSILTNNL
jgi:hypothetical protein